MKKEMKYFLLILITILLISCGRKVTSEEAEEKIAQHMYERYGEEFEVGYAMIDGYTKGDRNVTWYEARVTPIRYIGTPKYRDKYYKAVGTVMVKKKMFREEFGITRDTYSNVMLKESANEFYGKKLKELFGENYLSVLEVTGSYSDKSKNFEGSVKLTKEKGDRLYISGGIYIFGRVENDEDREWYRKQIYEFIQFMKETGTFEYVDLDIEVIDEKVLSENFKNNEILKNNLLENRKSWEKDEKDTKNYRDTKKLFLKEIKVNSNEILKNINEINKSQIKKNSLDWSYYNLLLYTKIYSLKYIKSNSIKGEKEKEYNKITDIEFDMGGYY
ncbi:hypothetical protein [Fusobacterium varium]|uniref:Lipoprotein n=1 Tax=Fusobacterium varium ATCC 27725 TaxID=469618 RepID=A0ABN5JIF6_FUSVA|nr:hypothetical protein [Fusobacterium varium]AVQ32039.1 hypothetical protein C4N18_12700 [Fusobacterium varium ATCC 27725]EES63400.2 hypothetical protein FVAG_01089 [Fusobacterium varium ATCC 27725]VEH39082.1 Uncharacterised protein [Fusobacterium varium]